MYLIQKTNLQQHMSTNFLLDEEGTTDFKVLHTLRPTFWMKV